ncbi:hypothetical protein WM45_18245 [Citrobacter sp. AATXR]|uniref:Tyrosine kinase G-rich domain-containing protein n=2 Tax=Citrobacter TaxID=544 RepID=A0AA44SIG5_CITFR|nr:hypothetical protein WM45_18245 [Citrobacter sp. AATXR]OYQ96297.1 hypothetical protein B9P90_14120 [Citrobacter freundii]OYQ96596.1 hypothetical protein B9P89_24455 [Citrobacter freundii]
MLGEKMSSNEEIDLLDFIKYAFNKYLLISFIVFFCIVIGGVFCYINNDKVTLTLDITPKVYSPFFYTSCNDDVECRNEIFKTLLVSRVDSRFSVNENKKSNTLNLKALVSRNEANEIENSLLSLNAALNAWYADDVDNVLQELNVRHADNKSTETLSRAYLITVATKRYLDKGDIVIISEPVVVARYNTTMVLLLSALVGLIFSLLLVMLSYHNRQEENKCINCQFNIK